ncbi:hypothetical protein V8Z80_02385 [Orrella sp. JC864]|uniref:hypothetical protein n=1 Tax=Orrella sp. JC864 TaxID=3120298 RepID=UPI00300BCB4C
MLRNDEPRNGDYVAYVEELARRGAAIPSQTLRELESDSSWRRALGPDARKPADTAIVPPGAATGWGDMPGLPPAAPDGQAGTAARTPYTPPAPPAPAAPRGAPGEQPARPRHARAQAAGQAQDGSQTLAGQSGRRRQGLGLLAIGAVLAALAVNMLLDPYGDRMGGAFLLLMAFIFTRAGLKQRRKSGGQLAKLPPLSTISQRDRHG